MSDGAPHHFSPLHLGPAGDPGERAGEDQGRPLDPQALFNIWAKKIRSRSRLARSRQGEIAAMRQVKVEKRLLSLLRQ